MSSNDGVLFPYILLENFAENFAENSPRNLDVIDVSIVDLRAWTC